MALKLLTALVATGLLTLTAFGQLTNTGEKVVGPAKPDKIIFAVVDNGARIEPIAFIESGRILNTVSGDAEPQTLKAFSELYYAPKTQYSLIFGGAADGKVEVKSGNPESDCGKNIAEVSLVPAKANLKGFVMALATNTPPKSTVPGTRRAPTAVEKTEIESLVRAELTKQKLSATAQKVLRYHNLTAVDYDRDGKLEIVGSYYIETSATERALLFFIAEKNAQGKYVFGHSEYRRIAQKDVMSQDIKDVDTGIYHELFLDVLDYDGDGKSDIFTVTQGFEGNSFTAYHRNAGKWVKVLEVSNYHCAF